MEDLKFTSTVDVDFVGEQTYFGYPDTAGFDIEFEDTKATVEWGLSFDIKDYGIRDIDITITRITCDATWYVSTYDLADHDKALLKSYGGVEYNNRRIEGSIEIDSTKSHKGHTWSINSGEVDFQPSGAITISDITVLLHDFSIEVTQ